MQKLYDKYEEEMSIFSVLWFCASRWKSILAVIIIGAILGCGFAVVKSQGDSGSEQTIAVEKEAAIEESALEQLYEYSEARMAELQDYMDESRLMEMNPFEVYYGSVTYRIEAPQSNISALDGAIRAYVLNGELYGELAAETDLYDIRDLVQLIGYTLQNSTKGVVEQSDTAGQTVHTIAILGATVDEAEELIAQIEVLFEAFLGEVGTEYAVSGFSIQDTSVQQMSSTMIADYQDDIRNELSNEKDNIKAQQEALEALGTTEESSSVADTGISKKALMLYGVLGAIVGGVIAICVWMLVFTWGGGLYAVDNIERKFNVKILGSIHDLQKMNVIDRWIAQRRGGVYSALPLEEQRKIALLNIKNELKKKDAVKKVFLVSSLGETIAEADILKSGLEAEGYLVDGCGNVIGRADVLEQASQCDAVIVVENMELSKADLVEAEVIALKEYVESVLGMVIVGNRK